MVMATPAPGLAGNFAAVRDLDMRAALPRISRPTLVIAGRHDTVTLASHGELIAAKVPGASLAMLDTVHMPNVEAPAVFLDAVLGFMAGGGPGGGGGVQGGRTDARRVGDEGVSRCCGRWSPEPYKQTITSH